MPASSANHDGLNELIAEGARLDSYSRRTYPRSHESATTRWERTSVTQSNSGWAANVMGGSFTWKAKARKLSAALVKLDAEIARTEESMRREGVPQ